MTIAKEVTGDGDAPDAPFTFTITDGHDIDHTVDVAAGDTSSPLPIPADTTLTITETIDHDADATTWTTTGTSGTGTTATLDIGEDEHVTITFTNRYDADQPPQAEHGDLVVTKLVDGETAPSDATFEVDIACSYGEVTFGWRDRIGHQGAMGPFLNLPAGATCVITELDPGEAVATTIDGVAGTTAVVEIEAGEAHEVTIVNTFPDVLDVIIDDPVTDDPVTEDPVTDDPVPPVDGEEVDVAPVVVTRPETRPAPEREVQVLAEVLERETLPRTGADAMRLAFLGGLLALIGGSLLRRPVRVRQR